MSIHCAGEGLHPFGDIKLLDQVFCSLKPGGVFFLAVPIGPDHLHWNTYVNPQSHSFAYCYLCMYV